MNKKRVGGLLFAGVFLSILFLNVVMAADLFDPVRDLFRGWQEGALSVNIAKFVLWGVLILLIYTILAFLPFLSGRGNEKKAIRWVLAVLIGFLAMAYMTPSDVYTILTSYSAMGIVLTGVIPFIVLLFFTIELEKEETGAGAGGRMLSNIIWIVFVIFVIYKLVDGVFFQTCPVNPGVVSLGSGCINVVEGGVYLLVIFGSLFFMWKGKDMFMKAATKSGIKSVARRLDEGKRDALIAEAEHLYDEAKIYMKLGNKDKAEKLTKRGDDLMEASYK